MKYYCIFLFISNLFISKAMGQQYETQTYTVIEQREQFEIRYYPPVMKIQSDNSFGNLFGYISGNNESSSKIAMTTPVYMGNSKGEEVMEFVLPNTFNANNTPQPVSSGVRVFQTTPAYFIALDFSGYATASSREKYSTKLKKLAQENAFETIGEPLLLVYNSPYRLFNRKNEILLEIAANAIKNK